MEGAQSHLKLMEVLAQENRVKVLDVESFGVFGFTAWEAPTLQQISRLKVY